MLFHFVPKPSDFLSLRLPSVTKQDVCMNHLIIVHHQRLLFCKMTFREICVEAISSVLEKRLYNQRLTSTAIYWGFWLACALFILQWNSLLLLSYQFNRLNELKWNWITYEIWGFRRSLTRQCLVGPSSAKEPVTSVKIQLPQIITIHNTLARTCIDDWCRVCGSVCLRVSHTVLCFFTCILTEIDRTDRCICLCFRFFLIKSGVTLISPLFLIWCSRAHWGMPACLQCFIYFI